MVIQNRILEPIQLGDFGKNLIRLNKNSENLAAIPEVDSPCDLRMGRLL